MDTIEAILSRRSIRKYTTANITDEQINIILKAAMYAPSAVNKQPWHFVVFRNCNSIKQIIEVHPNASMLAGASAAIMLCFDEHLQHDAGYGPVDCAAAMQNMLLAAHDMGLGSVWVGLYPRANRMEAVQRIFSLPEHVKGFAIVSLGYPAETKGQPDRFNQARIHHEKW
jgi:nitroreductase